jgi:hypothetical protein
MGSASHPLHSAGVSSRRLFETGCPSPQIKNIRLLGKRDEDSLINRALEAKLLGESELIAAGNVARFGNDVMHNVSSIQSPQTAAEETLVCTRKVLNRLYGDAVEAVNG